MAVKPAPLDTTPMCLVKLNTQGWSELLPVDDRPKSGRPLMTWEEYKAIPFTEEN